MFLMSLFLRLALFIIGSLISFELYGQDAAHAAAEKSEKVEPVKVEPTLPEQSIATKEHDLRVQQEALDAKLKALDAKLAVQSVVTDKKEEPKAVPSDTAVVEKKVPEKITTEKRAVDQQETAEKKESKSSEHDVAKKADDELADLKKAVAALTERVKVLEGRSAYSSLNHFFTEWVWLPLKKVWEGHRSTAGK